MSPQEGAPSEKKFVDGSLSDVSPGVGGVKRFGERAIERGSVGREGTGKAEELFMRLGRSLQRGIDFARGVPVEVCASLSQRFSAVGGALLRLDEKYVDSFVRMRASQGGVRFYDPEQEEITRPIHEAWKLSVLGSANKWNRAQVLFSHLVGELPRRIGNYRAAWRDIATLFEMSRTEFAAQSKARQDENLLRGVEEKLSLVMAERARLLNVKVLGAEYMLSRLDREIGQLRMQVKELNTKQQSIVALQQKFTPVNDNGENLYGEAMAA